MKDKNSRAYLMRKWQEYSFAAYEARLYLDTHPESRQALDYFNKFNRLSLAVSKELQQKYGAAVTDPDTELYEWSYVGMPWPWNENTEE